MVTPDVVVPIECAQGAGIDHEPVRRTRSERDRLHTPRWGVLESRSERIQEVSPVPNICVKRRTRLRELSRRKEGPQLSKALSRNLALGESDSPVANCFVQRSLTELPEPFKCDETLKCGCCRTLHV